MSEIVVVLQHHHTLSPDDVDVKFIGAFANEDSARSAIATLVLQPGFNTAPEGFALRAMRLNELDVPLFDRLLAAASAGGS